MALILATALPAPALTTPSSGSATAANTLLSLSYGTAKTSIGVDRATSTLGATRSAEAAMEFLVVGAQTISGGSKRATRKSDSGSQTLGTGTRTLSDLAAVTITGAGLDVSVDTDAVSSSANLAMGNLNLLSGLVTAATGQTSTASSVTRAESEVTRTLRLGSVKVLSIRKLLERLGIDPSDLVCSGVEAAGAELGAATGYACETMSAITAAIQGGRSALEAMDDTLQGDLATVQATIAGVTLATQPLIDLAAVYGIDLTGLLALLLPSADRDALVAEITRRIDAAGDGLSEIAAGTCTAATTALSDVQTAVPTSAATLAPLETAVDDACDTLQGILDSLLDTSLLGVDGVRVALTANAAPGSPFADGSGSIGSITVGNRSIAGTGLTSLSDALTSAISTARAEAGDALNALGIGVFPDPDIRLLGVSESSGQKANGAWFASVKVTAIHVGVPATPITLPSGTPVGSVLARPPALQAALQAGSAVRAPSARTRAGAPVATSPAIAVDAAVFTGDALFTAAGGPGSTTDGGSGSLPATGLRDSGLFLAGALALGLSWGARRLLASAG